MSDQDFDSGESSSMGQRTKRAIARLPKAEADQRKSERLARWLSDQKLSLPSVKRIIDNCPTRYRMGLLRAIVGEASPRQAIRAQCAQCVGWEDVAKGVGDCRVHSCALWHHRPYQTKKAGV